MSSKNKFAATIYDIFGYSFIGIIAFGFGLLLQNYDSQSELFNQFMQYSRFTSSLILLIAFHCLFICLFGFSYAVVIFYRAEQKASGSQRDEQGEVYNIAGKWIEIILVALFISVVVVWILDPSAMSLYFWGYLFCSGLIFIFPSAHYRIKEINVNSGDVPQTVDWTKQTKYVLICPAILMIGVNIYLGSSILELLRGNIIYYVPMVVLGLFFIAFFSANKPSSTKTLIIVFSVILLIAGFTSFIDSVSMPSRNAFLAIMVSIFMSIFECWYIAFRQLKDVPNKKYITVTSYIVTFTPAVVIALYPLQDFNIIYVITFFIGMVITQLLWFFKILPAISDKNTSPEEHDRLRKHYGTLRAILGLLVLVFLMLDKQIGKQTAGLLIRKRNFTGISILSIATVLGPITPFIDYLLKVQKHEPKGDTFFNRIKYHDTRAFLQLRLVSYVLPIALLATMDHFADLDLIKRDISWVLMALFIIIDIILLFYHSSKQREVEMSQNSSEE